MTQRVFPALAAVLFTCSMLTLSEARASEPTPGPGVSWSGFYVGVHGGVADAGTGGVFDEAGTEPFTQFGELNNSNPFGGIHAGGTLEIGGLVVGLEADYSRGGAEGSFVDGENDLQVFESDYLASVRGRIGAAADNLFVYLTAGIGFGEHSLIVENGEDRLTFRSTDFVYGAGVEYMVLPGVSIRGEMLHYAFDENFRATDALANGTNGAIDQLSDGDDADHFSLHGITVARVGVTVTPGMLRGSTSHRETVAAPAADFSGLYVGGHIGYGDSDVGGVFDTAGSAPFAEFALYDMNALNGGVTAGYHHQTGAVVVGLEADYTWNGSGDSFVDGEGDAQTLDSSYFATFRGKLGVVSGRTLFYATAGVAIGEMELTVENGDDQLTLDAVGIAFGGGVEYAISDRMSFKAEYLRLAFDEAVGGDNSAIDDLSDGDEDDSINFDGQDIVRVGVNVKLDGLFGR
ncbi:MAG: outer membrane beta-barrel protein [Pseudomonadota bacterium]